MIYQNARVGVNSHEGQLLISDLETGDRIAEHVISIEKGYKWRHNKYNWNTF